MGWIFFSLSAAGGSSLLQTRRNSCQLDFTEGNVMRMLCGHGDVENSPGEQLTKGLHKMLRAWRGSVGQEGQTYFH